MQITVAMMIICAIPALTSPVAELEEELRRFVDRENEHRGLSVAARSTGSSVTSAQKLVILELHNFIRNSVQPPAAKMPPLRWSNDLARVAQNHANRCILENNDAASSQSSIFSSVGENLYFTSESYGYISAVSYWASEKKNYNYSSNSYNPEIGYYTQMIWADTTHIGCGVKICPFLFYPEVSSDFDNAKYIVCNYGPAGNIKGQKPYVRKGLEKDC